MYPDAKDRMHRHWLCQELSPQRRLGRAVTLKSQHRQQQRFGFFTHCTSVKGRLCLCFVLSGTQADGEISVWDFSDFMGVGRELDNKAPAPKLFCPEVACVTSAHVGLAEQVPWSGLMSMGWKNIIFLEEETEYLKV